MADIGEPRRYIEFEPIPTTVPQRVEPSPAPAPAVAPEPEKVPA